LGDQTPCYSSLGSFLLPAPVPVGSYISTSDTSTLSGNNTFAASYTTITPSTSRIIENYTATTSYTTSSLSTSTASGTDTVTTTFTTVSITTTTQKPTSAVVNIVYALYYPIQPRNTLSTGAKAGISTGASLAGILLMILSILLIWRTRNTRLHCLQFKLMGKDKNMPCHRPHRHTTTPRGQNYQVVRSR
jgi:hypothetical protein